MERKKSSMGSGILDPDQDLYKEVDKKIAHVETTGDRFNFIERFRNPTLKKNHAYDADYRMTLGKKDSGVELVNGNTMQIPGK